MNRPASEPAETLQPRSRDELIAAVAAIVPRIEALAEANEAAGDLTAEAAALLKGERLYHLCAPPEAGGDGADILTAIELIETFIPEHLTLDMMAPQRSGPAGTAPYRRHSMRERFRRRCSRTMSRPGSSSFAISGLAPPRCAIRAHWDGHRAT